MKSKRGSNKIYYYIDLFFILLPILLLLGYFIYLLFSFKSFTLYYDQSTGINIFDSYFEAVTDKWGTIFDTFYDKFIYYLGFQDLTEDGILFNIYLVIDNIISWFGYEWNFDYTFINFIEWYFVYLILYEMFSLFINIIMWLPRWARNKVRDWSGSDSV